MELFFVPGGTVSEVAFVEDVVDHGHAEGGAAFDAGDGVGIGDEMLWRGEGEGIAVAGDDKAEEGRAEEEEAEEARDSSEGFA